MGISMNPPVINYSWPYLRYVGILGFPLCFVFYRRMLKHRRDPVERLIDISVKSRLVLLNGFAAIFFFAEACLCVWQIIGRD